MYWILGIVILCLFINWTNKRDIYDISREIDKHFAWEIKECKKHNIPYTVHTQGGYITSVDIHWDRMGESVC